MKRTLIAIILLWSAITVFSASSSTLNTTNMITVTGIYDDFSDGVVSPYWQPEHADDPNPPFVLTEADNTLEIVIDKSKAGQAGTEVWGFSALKFSFKADMFLDMTDNPYASVMIKTDNNVPFELGIADSVSGTNDVVISNIIVAGEEFTQLYFDFTGMFEGKQIQDSLVQCYLNFKPGWAAAGVYQGTVWLKDFRLGSEALLEPEPFVPTIYMAAHPPAIDGVLDDIWKTGPWYRDYQISGSADMIDNFQDASISWRGMYDDTYLYLFMQANDDTLVKDSGASPWLDDSYEVWIDGDNSKGTTYDGINDFGFQFLYSGDAENPLIFNKVTKSGNGKAGDFSGILQGAMLTDTGTSLEVAIPLALLGITPTPGYLVGFEVDWNDDDDGGTKESKVKYFNTVDNSWQNPSTLGTIVLGDRVQNDYTNIFYTMTAPVIDGVKDTFWSDFPEYVLNQYMNRADSLNSYQDLALSFNVAWDSTYLYYGIDVTDDVFIQDGTFSWQDDGIEFWFDGDNSKKTTYDQINDIGIKFSYIPGSPIDSVAFSAGGKATFDIASVPWAATQTEKGLYLEFALPLDSLGIMPTNDWKVGYEIDWNDDDTGGGKERDTKCKTFATDDNSWQNPSLFGTGKFVGGPGGSVPEKPMVLLFDKTTTAPVIDGVLDSTWFNVRNVNMIKTIDAAPDNWFDLAGRFRATWDSKFMYMFIEVQDDTIITTHADAYQNDGVEIYFDGLNTKNDEATGYGAKDDQLRFVFDQAPTSATGNTKLTKFEYAYLETDYGYNLEIKMPFTQGLTFKSAAKLAIGFEIQINDNDTGARDTMLRWWSDNNDSYKNPSLFGTAQFTARETSDKLDVQYTAYPVKVDAEMDYAWMNVPNIFANQRMTSFDSLSTIDDAEVNWKILWSYDYLYLLIDVVDDTFVRDSGTASYNDDGIELWFDGDHSAKKTYDKINDFGFSMPYNAETILDPIKISNSPTVVDTNLVKKIQQAQKLTEKGFIVELALPMALLDIEPGGGSLFGIEVDYNDDDTGGNKDTKIKTYDATDNTWQNPSLNGVARLLGSPLVSDVDKDVKIASRFVLNQNYPNPFNPSTTISFNLPTDSNVKLVVYDVLGREVARLVDNRLQAGEHAISFDASRFSSGIYFYRIQAGSNVVVKKMMFIK